MVGLLPNSLHRFNWALVGISLWLRLLLSSDETALLVLTAMDSMLPVSSIWLPLNARASMESVPAGLPTWSVC